MATVRLENVRKSFGKTVAVDNVNLDVRDKEFMVLLGPSGCGKTTVLRCVSGLEKLDGGSIYIDDERVDQLAPKDRNIAMVFQDYALYPHMTAYKNIEYPLKNRRVHKEERKNRVQEAAELLQIKEILDKKPSQMSGGQRQRVALARAIVRTPRVFLMDEPLSNLDAQLRMYARTELKLLQRELGTPTIFVTHDQVEAMSMADRITVMNHGAVQQVGDPNEIYTAPSNLFVAGFVGSPTMNFIPCTLVEEEDSAYLRIGETRYTISHQMYEAVKDYVGKEMMLGIRPEDLILSDGDKSNLTGEVYVVEPLGLYTIINIASGDIRLKAVASDPDMRVGQSVRVHFDETRMHLFDRKTEKVIV